MYCSMQTFAHLLKSELISGEFARIINHSIYRHMDKARWWKKLAA